MDNKELRNEPVGNLENLIGISNKVAENGIGLFQKKSKQGGWGYGISRGIKEIACGFSSGDQEKITWNFQGSWFLVLEFWHNFAQFPLGWNFDLSGISRGKVNKRKIPGRV